MNQFTEFQEREFEVLYVWDDILKKGFPITNDIKVLDLAKLTHDDRQVLAIGNDEEVSNLVAARGSTLAYQLKLSTKILGIVLQEIYHDSTPEIQEHISGKVKKVLAAIQEGALGDE